jgi:phosphoenolpyruvate synthase/pyruvate phosphate dikinase
MLLDFLKEAAKTSVLYKQEGSFSLLLSGAPCCYCLCCPAWREAYDFDFGFFLVGLGGTDGFFVFGLEKYWQVTEAELAHALATAEATELPIMERYRQQTVRCDVLHRSGVLADWPRLDLEALRRTIIEANEICALLSTYSVFSESVDEEMLKKHYLRLGGAAADWSAFVATATTPTFDSFDIRRSKLLLAAMEAGRVLEPREWQWLKTDYFSARPLSEITAYLVGLEADGLRRQTAESDARLANSQHAWAATTSGLPEPLRRLAAFSQLAMRLRDERKDYFAKAQTVLYEATAEFFRRLGLDPGDAVYAMYVDFQDGSADQADYGRLIEKRKHGAMILARPGVPIAYDWEFGDYGELRESALRIVDSSHQAAAAGSAAISGQVANPGVARGPARIIVGLKDFANFQPGDVLVTSMTRPEFVPLMRQAAAIVTDEGGITCHAAIISRELGVPCVIGTRNATRVIPDGATVEVDADSGKIHLLNQR